MNNKIVDIDIISNEAYRHGPPHEIFTRLRHESPIILAPGLEEGFPEKFWAITKHADLVSVSRQFQIYSSALKGSLMPENRPDLEDSRLMIDTDPPDHTRLRTLVNRGFTPKAMRMLEDHFREVAAELVSEGLKSGDVEFVEKISAELPLIAIAELVGIPVEDRHKVFDWSNRMIGSTDPDMSSGPEDAQSAAAELYMY
ncbi:MAG: cytochrome P450, partial [Ilumatobacteraceae bacterium]|nr:cytochrome P450 [Ilumatobacteraceae bacterium]